MLCGCASPVEARPTPATTTHVAGALRPGGLDDGRRLVAASPPSPGSSPRRCFSVRVRPSSATAGGGGGGGVAARSDESLGLGAEAEAPQVRVSARMRSYTLTDGATSAIGRILTNCFHDQNDGGASGSDDRPGPVTRPRSRSLWSRRRSPARSCLPTGGSSAAAGGCLVDVVLDCSPGSVRRRRLEAQSQASTSSTLQSDPVWKPRDGSEASCEVRHEDHPVWERRAIQPGRPPRQPRAPGPVSSDIPRPPPHRDCSDVAARSAGGDSTPTRPRRVARRATTSAIPRPQVRVVQAAGGGGGAAGSRLTVTESQVSVKPTTPCPVSWRLELGCFASRCSLIANSHRHARHDTDWTVLSCLMWRCELSRPDSQTGAFCVRSVSECVGRRSATAGRTPNGSNAALSGD